MSAKSHAQERFNAYYFILFDSDSDKGEEVLVSMLAKKCAKEEIEQMIVFAGFNNEYLKRVLIELNKL